MVQLATVSRILLDYFVSTEAAIAVLFIFSILNA